MKHILILGRFFEKIVVTALLSILVYPYVQDNLQTAADLSSVDKDKFQDEITIVDEGPGGLPLRKDESLLTIHAYRDGVNETIPYFPEP